MRLAFVGKGGVGKSAIAGTFARTLARRGEPVLAVDSDPLPGLAFSLGLAIDHTPPIPDDVVVERQKGETGPRYRLRPDLDVVDAVERYSVEAPDGVRFLQFGKIKGDQDLWRSQMGFRHMLGRLPDDRWHLIGDLPGGTRQAFTGWGDYARLVLVVVEPTAKSLLSGRRLARMALMKSDTPRRVMVVASKVREPGDTERVVAGTGLELAGSVPWDEDLAEAERRSLAPIDHAPRSAAVLAVASLVDLVMELGSKERVA